MPIIRLHNPKRRQTKRAAPRRRSTRRNRNSLGEGVLTFMANPKHKRRKGTAGKRRTARNSYRTRARASNPAKKVSRKRHSRRKSNPMTHVKRHHRRRNPGGFGLPDLTGLAKDAAYLAGGGIAARSLPQLLVPQYNTGWMGYGMNLLTAVVTAGLMAKVKMFGPNATKPWLLGGFAFTLSRMLDDFAGLKILSFAQYTPPFQLAGDATYGMRGIYANVDFPLPSDSQRALPAPAALPPGTHVKADGTPAQAGMGWDNSFN